MALALGSAAPVRDKNQTFLAYHLAQEFSPEGMTGLHCNALHLRRKINRPRFWNTVTETLSIPTGLDQPPLGFRWRVRPRYPGVKNPRLLI